MDVVNAKRRTAFQKRAVAFHKSSGRDHLPWRVARDPWLIILAEMLLRKTTALQASGVYAGLQSLSLSEIADLSEADLERMLHPLGIQKERARLIRNAARIICDAPKVNLRDEEFLISIPGIGRYAASAVQCIAYGVPKPALDRNMIRILERVFSVRSLRSRPHTDPWLWEFAETLVPRSKPREYNWGLLDLAAALCRPANPACGKCPMASICDYASKLGIWSKAELDRC